ncbi:MAG TPA: hypothetical protein QF361_00535 [Gammaproteobacteria bacterium]|nr:hypothetical protein [Gammaproteobacteria bacterium]
MKAAIFGFRPRFWRNRLMTHVRTLLTSSAFSMLLALGAAPALAQLGSGAGGSTATTGQLGTGTTTGQMGAGTTPGGAAEGGVIMQGEAGVTGGRFGRADVNRDQRIDEQEFGTESGTLFGEMDTDQSGQISESEFNNRRATDFGEADRNADGSLDSGEYTGFYGSGNAGYTTGVTGSDTILGTPEGSDSP